MQDPRSKTVKGLGIAVVVLSVISILVSFMLIAVGTGVIATADETAATTNEILEEAGVSKDISNLLEATEGLDGSTLIALGDYLGSLDVDQVHHLGDVMADKNVKAITKFINKTAGDLDASEKSIVLDALTNLNKNNSKTLGEALQAVEQNDLDDLSSLMVSMSSGSLGQIINDAKQESGQNSGKDVSQQLTSNVIGLGGGMLVALGIMGLIASLLALVAGILGICNNTKPSKLTGAFVLGIIAAICAFFTGRIVSMILLIIMTVYVSKVRALRNQPAAGEFSAGAGQAPVPPQQ